MFLVSVNVNTKYLILIFEFYLSFLESESIQSGFQLGSFVGRSDQRLLGGG
jgi:hypothetical protein